MLVLVLVDVVLALVDVVLVLVDVVLVLVDVVVVLVDASVDASTGFIANGRSVRSHNIAKIAVGEIMPRITGK